MKNMIDDSQSYFDNRRDTNKSHTGQLAKGRKTMNLSDNTWRKKKCSSDNSPKKNNRVSEKNLQIREDRYTFFRQENRKQSKKSKRQKQY